MKVCIESLKWNQQFDSESICFALAFDIKGRAGRYSTFEYGGVMVQKEVAELMGK